MLIAKNKLCDAISRLTQYKESIERRNNKQFKSEVMQDINKDTIELEKEIVEDMQQNINNYLIQYPEEKCSMKCLNCPLSMTV